MQEEVLFCLLSFQRGVQGLVLTTCTWSVGKLRKELQRCAVLSVHEKSALSRLGLTCETKSVSVLQSPQHFQPLWGIGNSWLLTLECVEPYKNCPLACELGKAPSYFMHFSITTVPWWTQHFFLDRNCWKSSGFCRLFPQRCQALAWKIRDEPFAFLRVLSRATSSVKPREKEETLIPPQDPGSTITLGSSTLNLS